MVASLVRLSSGLETARRLPDQLVVGDRTEEEHRIADRSLCSTRLYK